jgi:hypothetical protein
MNDQSTQTNPGDAAVRDSRPFRALRIWPAALLICLMLVARFGPSLLEGGLSAHWMIAVFGPLLCCLLMLIWWVAVSRATWRERLCGFVGIVAAQALTLLLVDPTMRGPGTTYLTLPMGMLAFVLAAICLAKRRPLVMSHFGGEFDRNTDGSITGVDRIDGVITGETNQYYRDFARAMHEIGYRGYISYELCHQLPLVNGETVGIEFAHKNAQLAVEFMREIVKAEYGKKPAKPVMPQPVGAA